MGWPYPIDGYPGRTPIGAATNVGCGPFISEGATGAALFSCGSAISSSEEVAARNMEPIPGSHKHGTSIAEAKAPQPRAQNMRLREGLEPALPWRTRMRALPRSAPMLPPAPVIPATPPTAFGKTYGTTAKHAPAKGRSFLKRCQQKLSKDHLAY